MAGGGAVAEAVGVMAKVRTSLADPEAGERMKDVHCFGDGLAFGKKLRFRLG